MAEKQTQWIDWMNMNPRPTVPDDMKDFFAFASNKYIDNNIMEVAGCSVNDEEELEEELNSLFGDAMELLLLYRDYLNKKK